MSSTYKDADFTSLLPPNGSQFEQAYERAMHFSPAKQIPDYVAKHWHPNTCPEDLLPWLAWSLSVDEWDEQWSSEAKRALIQNSVSIHKHKGTVGAVKRALSSLGVVMEFFEWFEEVDDAVLVPIHKKDPNTFTFIAWANDVAYTSQEVVLNLELYDAIHRVTNQTKPQRAHFDFLVGAKLDAGLTVGATSSALQVGRINYDTVPVKAAPNEITAGLTVASQKRYGLNRQHGVTRPVQGRLTAQLSTGLHFNNQRHTVGRFYMQNSQKLPAGCYYLQSGIAAGCHISNKRYSVGRFYLHPNE